MTSHQRSQPWTVTDADDETALTRADPRRPPPEAMREHTPWHRPHAEPAPLDATAELGRLEDHYELHEEIARGGMATVHLGRLVAPGVPRVVAIKRLHAQLAWNPSFVAMFLDEARLAARVHHPNVVAPLDFLVRGAEGELCLVMEYVHGETLAHLLNRAVAVGRAPSPAVAAAIMIGVLRGLQAAHQATTDDGTALEIVHRDISPQNVMVGADGVARVLDFGVARARMQEAPAGERDRGGKPAYLAPEQIRFQKIDRRADLFSAGVVLWEMLAGCRLFRHDDPRMIWVNILSGEIPPPSRFNAAVSPALERVVLQALERDRGRRFPTAHRFAQALAEAIAPAPAAEVARWVASVAGAPLARRAQRIAEIMAGAPPARTRHARSRAAAWVARLIDLLSLRRRWNSLGLLVAALTGMALSSESSRALLGHPPATVAITAPSKAERVQAPPPVSAPPAACIPSVAAPPTTGSADDQPAPDPAPAVVVGDDDHDHDVTDVEPPSAPGPAPAVVVPAAPRARPAAPANGWKQALARITQLNGSALSSYRRGNFDAAEKTLRQALALGARARLQGHPVAAVTHAYLGVVMVGGFKQSQLGVEQFRQALRINPDVPFALPLSVRNSRAAIAAAFRQAAART